MNTTHLLKTALMGLLFTATTAFAGNMKVVTFHGRLHVADPAMGAGTVILTIEGQEPEAVQVGANGHFRVFVPEGRLAALAFSYPGHLTKTVLVRTDNAFCASHARGRDRKVEFDVMLSATAPERAAVEEHLVGLLRFLKGSGLLKVEYDPAPVALRSGAELIAGH